MTYVPVPDGERLSPAGRPPMEIPDALIRWLQHSDATGQKLTIDLTDDDKPEDIAELRRTLIRAGYRHFPGKTIRRQFTDTALTFWVEPKRKRPTSKKSGGKKS